MGNYGSDLTNPCFTCETELYEGKCPKCMKQTGRHCMKITGGYYTKSVPPLKCMESTKQPPSIWDIPLDELTWAGITQCLREIYFEEYGGCIVDMDHTKWWNNPESAWHAGKILGPLILRYKINVLYLPAKVRANCDRDDKQTAYYYDKSGPRAIALAIIDYYRKYMRGK